MDKNVYIPQKKSLVTITINPYGTQRLVNPKDRSTRRELFFINTIESGNLSHETILVGQFLFKFEKSPKETLGFAYGSTTRLYFPEDIRIASFETSTPAEIDEFVHRMNQLADSHLIFAALIKDILDKLSCHQ